MAPSVAELPQNLETSPITLPVKVLPGAAEAKAEATETKPKIRRVIDEEGGTTTASVRQPY